MLKDVDWVYVEWYDAFDPGDHWKTHLIYRPMSVNDLRHLNHTMGVWLNVACNDTLVVTGRLRASTTIELKAGWNHVGYPSLKPKPIFTALAGTGYDMVEGFDANAPYRVRPLPDTYSMRPFTCQRTAPG